MQHQQMSNKDFAKHQEDYVDRLVAVSDDHAQLIATIEKYKTLFTREQLGDLLADAVSNNVDVALVCTAISDLHDESIYLKLVQESYGAALESIPVDDRTYNICLHAVGNDGMLLQHVPEELLNNELCLVAVSLSPMACEIVPPKMRTHQICLLAVADWRALIYVPGEFQTEQVLMTAIRNNYRALFSVEAGKRTKNMYIEAAYQYSNILGDVPDNMYCYEICHAAVMRNANAIASLKRKLLSEEEFLDLVRTALQKIPETINLLTENLITAEEKDKLLTPELCLKIVDHDGALIEYLPIHKRTREVCIQAVQQNSLATKHVNWDLIPEEEAYQLIPKIVANNPSVLEFIPERFKNRCIDELTVEYILSRDFKAYRFLPVEYHVTANRFFQKIKHVIITNITDHELMDIFLVYANTGSRVGVTTCCESDEKDDLLKLLTSLGVKDINVVFLGHAVEASVDITDVSIPEMIKFLHDFEIINRVNLMGCNTAKALELDEEVKIADRFKREFTELSDCAFALMSKKPDNLADCMDRVKQNSLYILVKYSKAGNTENYKLYFVSRENGNPDNCSVKHFNLNQDGFNIIKHIISPHGRGFKFPKGNRINLLRGQKAKNALPNMTLHEFMVLKDACHNRDRSDKSSHGYKEYKKIAAYLANVTIEGDEIVKLQDSLLKKLVTAIEQSDISRSISVKGYTQPVYVDTVQRRLHTSKTHLYIRNKPYPASFFASREDNIDRDKLNMDRTSFIAKIRKSAKKKTKKNSGEQKLAKVKSIKVVTRIKK